MKNKKHTNSLILSAPRTNCHLNKVWTNGTAPDETHGRSSAPCTQKDFLRRTDREAAISDDGESEGAQKIAQSIAYMLEHLDQPLQVATLAARACVSPSHFFVLFKRSTGCPPIDYFIRLRMHRARELLEAGSLHVKEVAAALGYEDPFYFSRMFKSVNHVAPVEYRRLIGKPKAAAQSPKLPPVAAAGFQRATRRLPEFAAEAVANQNRTGSMPRHRHDGFSSTANNFCHAG
jgi:AraC-like DNA-binding protein